MPSHLTWNRLAVLAAVAALAFASTARAEEWGSLTGKFVYDGTPPEPKPIVVTQDVAEFGKLGLVDESLVVDKKTGGIANIVVFVKTKDVKVHPDLLKDVKKVQKFDNKGGRFVPHVLPIWLEKQTLCLCNSDGVPHNSKLDPFGDTAINPLIPPKAEVEHNFSAEQDRPTPVKCNIHPWMQGWILPRNNPYVAITGPDGSFTLDKLPAGAELAFSVWQEKAGWVVLDGWTKGSKFQFKKTLAAGKNDLGTLKVKPEVFDK